MRVASSPTCARERPRGAGERARAFPQQLPSAAAPGSVVIDDGSFTGAPLDAPAAASNACSSEQSAPRPATRSSSPGPRSGTSSRSSSPRWSSPARDSRREERSSRGPFVLVGRGPDFAWSVTSSQADNLDLFVETLCGDDRHYLYRGQCEPMRRFFAGTSRRRTTRPAGRVLRDHARAGRGLRDGRGKRVAISMQRSTRGRELLSTRAFYELNTGRVTSAQDSCGR